MRIVLSMMLNSMIGEVIGFLSLLGKILEEMGRGIKKRGSGSGNSERKKMSLPMMER